MIKKAFLGLSLLTIGLFVTQLVVANGISGGGTDMRELVAERGRLQRQVRALKLQVAALGSLSEIEDRAVSFGFARQKDAADFPTSPKLAKAQ